VTDDYGITDERGVVKDALGVGALALEATATPFPEAIDGKAWTITPLPPGVLAGGACRATHTMRVPVTNDEAAATIRAHEMGHVKWSPAEPPQAWAIPGVRSPDAVNACEDVRINKLLTGIGIPLTRTMPGEQVRDGIRRLARTGAVARCAYYLACTVGLPEHQDALEALLEISREPVEDSQMLTPFPADKVINCVNYALATLVHSDGLDFNRALEAATSLTNVATEQERLTAQAEREAKARRDAAAAQAQAKAEAEEAAENGDEEDAQVAEDAAKTAQKMIDKADMRRPEFPNAIRWNRHEVVVAPLTRAHPAAVRALRRRTSTEGYYVTRPDRWSVDGAIFGQDQKAFGASLLIDVSGSMALTVQQVDDIISAAPAAVIATYTSSCGLGIIHVIARNGRRVGDGDGDGTNLHPYGVGRGCNGIDGPALEWLGKQRGPRIWVSDGQVNGYGGTESREQYLECATLCAKHRIARVNGADRALNYVLLIKQRGERRAFSEHEATVRGEQAEAAPQE
jgi:hypothetical protein